MNAPDRPIASGRSRTLAAALTSGGRLTTASVKPTPSITRVANRAGAPEAYAPANAPAALISRPRTASRRWPKRSAKMPNAAPDSAVVRVNRETTSPPSTRVRSRSAITTLNAAATLPIWAAPTQPAMTATNTATQRVSWRELTDDSIPAPAERLTAPAARVHGPPLEHAPVAHRGQGVLAAPAVPREPALAPERDAARVEIVTRRRLDAEVEH